MTATEQQPINQQIITTIAQAFTVLGIVDGVSKQSQINEAFRARVKASHKGGDYDIKDMDAYTQAKEFLTRALKEAQEQGQRDQARNQASQQEKEERTQANQKTREQEASKQKKEEEPTKREPKPAPESLRLGPATSQGLEALRAYEREKAREREQTRRVWSYQVSQEQARTRRDRQSNHHQQQGGTAIAMQPGEPGRSQELAKPQTGNDPIQSTLHLLQQRRNELEETRTQEEELEQALSRTQQRRAGLEQIVQTASALADQLRAVLVAGAEAEEDQQC